MEHPWSLTAEERRYIEDARIAEVAAGDGTGPSGYISDPEYRAYRAELQDIETRAAAAEPWLVRMPVRAAGTAERMLANFGKMGGDILGGIGDAWENSIESTPDAATYRPPGPSALSPEEYELTIDRVQKLRKLSRGQAERYVQDPGKFVREEDMGPDEATTGEFGVEWKPKWYNLLQGIRDTSHIAFDVSGEVHWSGLAEKQAQDSWAWHEQNKSHPAIKMLDMWSGTAVDSATALGTLFLLGQTLGGKKGMTFKMASKDWTTHARTFARGFSISEGNPLERAKGGLMMAAYSATPTAVAMGPAMKSSLGIFFKDMAMNVGISGWQYAEMIASSYHPDGTFDWEYFTTNLVNLAITDAIPSLLTPGSVRIAHARGRLGLKGGIAPRERGKGVAGRLWGKTREGEYNLVKGAGLSPERAQELLKIDGAMLSDIVGRANKGEVTDALAAEMLKTGADSESIRKIYREANAGFIPRETAYGRLLGNMARTNDPSMKIEVEHILEGRETKYGKEAEKALGETLGEGKTATIAGRSGFLSGDRSGKLFMAHNPQTDGTTWWHETFHNLTRLSRKLYDAVDHSPGLRALREKYAGEWGIRNNQEMFANVGVARVLNTLKEKGLIKGPRDLISSKLDGAEGFIQRLDQLMEAVKGEQFEPIIEKAWKDQGLRKKDRDVQVRAPAETKPGTKEDVAAALDEVGKVDYSARNYGKHPWELRPGTERTLGEGVHKFKRFLAKVRKAEGGGVVYATGWSPGKIALAKRTMEKYGDHFNSLEMREIAKWLRTSASMYSARKGEEKDITEGSGEYVYHGTNEDVLENIAKEGLKPSRKGTLSFSTDEAYAKSFAREGITPKGKTSPVMLRVKSGILKGKTISDDKARPLSDEMYEKRLKETIPPENIEILIDGKWIPLSPKQPNITEGSRRVEQAHEGVAKEPWAMTYDEVLAAVSPGTHEELQAARPILRELYGDELNDPGDPWGIVRAVERGDELPRVPTVDLSVRHRAAVAQAIADGKTVPDHVLADYPDLAKEPSKGIPTAKKDITEGSRTAKQIDRYSARSWKTFSKNLTPAEREKRRSDTIANVMELAKSAPSDLAIEQAALRGKAARKWYRQAGRCFRFMFGQDMEQFTAVFAAMSPHEHVAENLKTALRAWNQYTKALEKKGSPLTREELEVVFRDNGDVQFGARHDNVFRALLAEDLRDITFSDRSYKVTSFYKNLMGNYNAVTLDSWMETFFGFKEKAFSSLKAYLAGTAAVRRVARKLDWHPAEVQAAVWAWWKTLVEKQNAIGDNLAWKQMDHLTDAEIADAGEVSRILREDLEIGKLIKQLKLKIPGERDINYPGEETGATPLGERYRPGDKRVLKGISKRAEWFARQKRISQLVRKLEPDPGDPFGVSKLDNAARPQLETWAKEMGIPKGGSLLTLKDRIRATLEAYPDPPKPLEYFSSRKDTEEKFQRDLPGLGAASKSVMFIPETVAGLRDKAMAHIELMTNALKSFEGFDELPINDQARYAGEYQERILERINTLLFSFYEGQRIKTTGPIEKVDLRPGMGTWTEEGSTAANAGVTCVAKDFERLQDFLCLGSKVGKQSGYYAMKADPEGDTLGLRIVLSEKLDPRKMAWLLSEISEDQEFFQGTLVDREQNQIWIGMGQDPADVRRAVTHLKKKLSTSLHEGAAEIVNTTFKIGENYGTKNYNQRIRDRGLQKVEREISRDVYPELRKIRSEIAREIKKSQKRQEKVKSWAEGQAGEIIRLPDRGEITTRLEKIYGEGEKYDRYEEEGEAPSKEEEIRWLIADQFQADAEYAAVQRDKNELAEILYASKEAEFQKIDEFYSSRIAEGPGFGIEDTRTASLRESLEWELGKLYQRFPELKRLAGHDAFRIPGIMGRQAIAVIRKGDWPAVGRAIQVAETAAGKEKDKADKIQARLERAQLAKREAKEKTTRARQELRRKLIQQKNEALERERELRRISSDIARARRNLNKQISHDLRTIQKITSKKAKLAPQIADAVHKIFGGYTWRDLSKRAVMNWPYDIERELHKAQMAGKTTGLDINSLVKAFKTPSNKLTVDQLADMAALARQLTGLNRGIKNSRYNERMDNFYADREALTGLKGDEHTPIPPSEGRGTKEGFWDKAKGVWRTWDSWMYRADRLYEKFGKPFHELIFKRIDRAHDTFLKATDDFRKSLDAVMANALGDGDIEAGWERYSGMDNSRVKVGDRELYETEILSAYMYSQNQDACGKLLKNNGWGAKDLAAIRQYVLDRPEMKEIADEIFKMHAKQYPYLRDLIFRLTGKNMGHQKNYIPLMTVRDILAMTESDTVLDMLTAFNLQPSVDKTFALGRRPHGKQLELDLTRNLFHSMETVNRFLTMGDALDRANKLMNDPDIRAMLSQQFGKEAARVGQKWIHDLISPRTMRHDIEPVIHFFRTRAVTSVLGLNVLTAMKQGLSTMAAMSFVRPDYMLRGWTEVIKDRRANREFVGERDEKVRQRFARGSVERDVMEARKAATGTGIQALRGKAARGVRGWPEKSLVGIKLIDRLTVEAVWRGAYEQKMAETKGDDRAAKDFARMVVRRTQPMGGEVDLPHIFRGGEMARLFTTFQNQVNQNYMLLRHDAYRDFMAGNPREAWAKVLFAYILPALILGVISRGRPHFDEEWKVQKGEIASDLINYPTAGMFLANNLIQGAVGVATGEGAFARQPMALKAMESPLEFFKALRDPRKDTLQKMEAGARTAGLITGMPVQAPLRTVKGATRLATGKAKYGVRELAWSPWSMKTRGASKKKAPEKKQPSQKLPEYKLWSTK